MSWRVYILFVALLWAYFLLQYPISGVLLAILGGMSGLLAIPVYFETKRGSTEHASRAERHFATAWLWIRRIAGSVGACVFLAAAGMVVFAPPDRLENGERLIAFLVLLALSAFCGWVAWVGQGNNEGAFGDDLRLHRENKRRYKWK